MTFPLILKQFWKYCNVGMVGAVGSYALFWVLYHVGVQYLIASAIGYVACMTFAYVVNRRWTFKNKHHVLVGYVFVCGCSLLVSTLLMHLLVEYLGIWEQVAPLLVMGVSTVMNFLGFRFLLGRKG